MIPVEAMEASTGVPYEAIVEASRSIDDDAYAILGWEGISRILEAAAPYIRARALEDAASAIRGDGDPRDTLTINWLTARAGAERSHGDE